MLIATISHNNKQQLTQFGYAGYRIAIRPYLHSYRILFSELPQIIKHDEEVRPARHQSVRQSHLKLLISLALSLFAHKESTTELCFSVVYSSGTIDNLTTETSL
jgi:hypothetical protein